MRLHQSTAAAVVSPHEDEAAHRPRRRSLSLQLELLLASGGDERIWPDPVTGRNRFGMTIIPAPHEIWFSSSTASAPSLAGHRVALETLARLFDSPPLAVNDWFDTIRARILRSYGIAGAAAILTASGTHAELMAVAVARALLEGPLTNVLIAQEEIGAGVSEAAAGRHFLASAPHRGALDCGWPIEGFSVADVELASIGLRSADGRKRPREEVDTEVLACCAPFMRGLLLHVLDCSTTGLAGPSPAVARALMEIARGRVLVVVDACQLRCSPADVRRYLGSGFMVLLTGSKFLGGAPSCGCLLLPPALADALAQAPPAPSGLDAYTASLDVPQRLRRWFAHGFGATANIGLGLRWMTALAELDRYEAIREAWRARILATFAEQVRARASALPWLRCEPPSAGIDPNRGSIVTLVIENSRRGLAATREAAKIHADLREPYAGLAGDAVCHLGPPVAVGERAALRICASAPLVSGIAKQLNAGLSFETAFAPVTRDLDTVFAKWAAIGG